MLTEGQTKYLAKVPDDQKMVVKPFNPKGLEVANQIIAEIKAVEPDLEAICVGSVPLKIAGQEDIDINVVWRASVFKRTCVCYNDKGKNSAPQSR